MNPPKTTRLNPSGHTQFGVRIQQESGEYFVHAFKAIDRADAISQAWQKTTRSPIVNVTIVWEV